MKTIQNAVIKNEKGMIYDPPHTGDFILSFAQWPIHCVSKVNTNIETETEELNQLRKMQ